MTMQHFEMVTPDPETGEHTRWYVVTDPLDGSREILGVGAVLAVKIRRSAGGDFEVTKYRASDFTHHDSADDLAFTVGADVEYIDRLLEEFASV